MPNHRTGALVALALLALALPACGGGEPTTTLPARDQAESELQGHPVYPAADMAEAKSLCAAIQDDWPDSGRQVTFNLPNTGRDLTCMKAN